MSGLERDDLMGMALEAGLASGKGVIQITKFAALVAAAEREKVAKWMIQRSYATGHGDTLEDLLQELDWQIADGWNRALMNGVETEREACAKLCEDIDKEYEGEDVLATWCAAAIRARGRDAA